ncbi:MAG: HAD family phosphatase [Candidatus Cloacimonetes bacterium]|nr:HAD family phosphatase [Candidatus Cloacimonadota bacterium]
MSNKYKAIVFDLGNVVIDVSIEPACVFWAEKFDLTAEEIMIKFPFDEVYAKFEKGLVDAEAFRQHLREYFEIDFSRQDFDTGWNMILKSLTSNIEDLILKLKDKYRLAVLSNTNEIHIPVFEKLFDEIFEYFEKKFYSNQIHARKPEKKAYEKVLDYFGYYPDTIVILDDREDNIRQAKSMGFEAILVESTPQLKHQLKELKILE